MSRRRKAILALVALLSVAAAVGFGIYHLASVRVIGHVKTQNGTELCIVQQPGDLLDTSIYVRKPGGRWAWFYFDHEDFYWGKAKIVVDEENNIITILKGGETVATYNWRLERYHSEPQGGRVAFLSHAVWMPTNFVPGKVSKLAFPVAAQSE